MTNIKKYGKYSLILIKGCDKHQRLMIKLEDTILGDIDIIGKYNDALDLAPGLLHKLLKSTREYLKSEWDQLKQKIKDIDVALDELKI